MFQNCCTLDVHIPTQWFHDFEKELPEMTGKRVAITGCSAGIGLIAAKVCARKGAAEVFMLNLESDNPEEVRKQILAVAPGTVLHHIGIDLANFASVRSAVEVLKSKCKSLDVLMCNAGIAFVPDQATGDGFNNVMQINHLSHFLIIKEMLPALEAAAEEKGEARIVHQASAARNGKPLNEAFYGPNGGKLGIGNDTWEPYHQSKMANLLFTYALEAKLAKIGSKVKAVACAPGVTLTSIVKTMGSYGGALPCGTLLKCFSCLGPRLAQSAEDGAMPMCKCIADKNVESGDFILPSLGVLQEFKGPPKTLRHPLPKVDRWQEEGVFEDPSTQEKLWALSEKAIGEEFVIA